jgi:hypothetical protein
MIYTPELRQKYAEFLRTHSIVHGVGTSNAACTIAAFNIAATGAVTDDRPDCMSDVTHRWIIRIQDAIPLKILNSNEWRSAAIDAPGTGNAHEDERIKIIMDWMWGTALPIAQPVADANGFGAEWWEMCKKRTTAAADAAADAADADAADAALAAAAAAAAADAADAAADAARAAAYVAYAAAAADAADAAYVAAYAAAWKTLNPAALLRRLCDVSMA